MTDFQLSDHDKATGLWLRLKSHLEDRLAWARTKNDGPLSEYETATLRGEIKALKTFIRLGDGRTRLARRQHQTAPVRAGEDTDRGIAPRLCPNRRYTW